MELNPSSHSFENQQIKNLYLKFIAHINDFMTSSETQKIQFSLITAAMGMRMHFHNMTVLKQEHNKINTIKKIPHPLLKKKFEDSKKILILCTS